MEQPKMELMLQLMKLLSGGKDISIEQLSELLSTSPRNIYRYIETLKESGFVVKKVRPNVYKIVKMPVGTSRLSSSMFFSREEIKFLENLFKDADASYSLKCSTRNKLASIYETVDIAPYLSRKSDSPKVKPILDAIKQKRQVLIRSYRSERAEGARVDLTVEPYEFVTGYEKVWVYDVKSLDNVLIDLSRVLDVEILDSKWSFAKNHNAGHLDIFGGWGDDKYIIKLQLSDKAVDILQREYPTSSAYLTKSDEGNILEVSVTSLESAARFCIGLSKEITIIDSPELVAYIQSYIQGYLLFYLEK
ncbi:MAG: WYL domain-containing protein [Bacteroidales bacterium]|nr:WYL domain-containing protein [Bacteroidales bacterium]